MNQMQMMRQLFDFNKAVFEKTLSAMTEMQDQTEKMFILWIDQNKLFPEQGKDAMAEWVRTCKENRDEFKEKIEAYFASLEKLGKKNKA